MTETVTLRLSSELVARARAEAELIGQPVEDVLADWASERDRDHERFLRLAARWKAERLSVSSPTQLTDHPAYTGSARDFPYYRVRHEIRMRRSENQNAARDEEAEKEKKVGNRTTEGPQKRRPFPR